MRHNVGAAYKDAGPSFDARLHNLSRAYIGYAARRPALHELMFAGKQRAGADDAREAADRAFATSLAVIAEAQAAGELRAGDPGRVAIVVLATLQGLAAMANGGARGEQVVDEARERIAARRENVRRPAQLRELSGWRRAGRDPCRAWSRAP